MDEDLGKLGLDSMAAIDLLLDLEKEFQIQIPDSLLTAEAFATGGALAAAIQPLLEM
jgi:acyl carrier protein